MKITIGFSKPLNNPLPLFSWAIKSVYNIPYSHTYLKFYSDSLDRDIIYESVGPGVRFIGLKLWSKYAETIKEFDLEITNEQYIELMQFCVDNAGIKYGIKQVLGIYIAKLFRMKKNVFKNGTDMEVCSEILGRILQQLGYEFNKDLDLLSPKDIYQALDK